MSKPIHITSDNFDSEVVKSDVPVVVDFWAPWCGPCKRIGPVLDELASTFAGKVKVAKVNTDDEPALAQAFQVRGIPTLAVIIGGEVAEMQVGFKGKAPLVELFEKLAADSAASAIV